MYNLNIKENRVMHYEAQVRHATWIQYDTDTEIRQFFKNIGHDTARIYCIIKYKNKIL